MAANRGSGESAGARALGLALGLTAALTALRVWVLFASPLDLYPDEAQYWVWSRALAAGYFSKPPLVAWAIAATTALGGDAEPFVRLAAPLFQAGAMLCAFALGRRLYGPWAGLAGAALYALAPAVQLSSAVIATDAPLVFFLGLALIGYAALPAAAGGRKLAWAALLGAAAGLALLSKYAAIYLLAGAALHLALSPAAWRAWTPAAGALALAGALAILGPNLAWNAAHSFATFHHTVADADWDRGELVNPAGLGRFVLEQALIFGVIPACALALAAVRAVRRRRFEEADLMLGCFAAAPLAIVAAQAFISRANANWAAAAYLPGAVLAGGLLVRWRAHRWLWAALTLQALGAAAFIAIVVSPRAAALAHADNSFKRVRGWRETAALVLDRASAEQAAGGLSAVAVDNRFLFHELAYYGRERFADPRNPPLRAWLAEARPQNQAELAAPLTPALGRRVLVASYEGWRAADVAGDFRRTSPPATEQIRLDPRHQRRIVMFVGEDLAPKPRH